MKNKEKVIEYLKNIHADQLLSDKGLDEIWSGIDMIYTYDSYNEELKRRSEKDKELLEMVKYLVSEDAFADILYSIEISECTYNYTITKEHYGEYQDEDFRELGGMWVDQSCGYSGDDFNGTVSLKIAHEVYFQYSYEM